MARPRKNPLSEEMGDQVTATEPTPEPRKKGTRPGWKPAGQLPKLKARDGYTAKWANPEKLPRLKAEGWIVMKPSDNKGDEILNVDVNDSKSLTGELRYRDLVAVMLPNEQKQARDEWVKAENGAAMKNILKQTDEQLKDMGVETYKPNDQAGRVVIE